MVTSGRSNYFNTNNHNQNTQRKAMCADTDQCALCDLRGLTPDSTSRARSHSVVPVNPHSAATPSVHDWDSPPRPFQPFLMAPTPRIVPDSTLTDRSRRRQSGRECQRGHICQPSCSASHQEFGDRHATAGPPGPPVQQHGPPRPPVQQHCKPRSTQRSLGMGCT